ncbi:hypothetical protein MASR2M50_24840 [Thauera sp.]
MLVVLIVAQSLALVRLNEEMEEEFIDGTLDEQLHYSIEHSRRLGTLIGPQTPNMTLYRFAPGEALPPGLSPALAALAVGKHEDWSAGRELHVAVREADGQRYVLIYDESEHRARETAVVTTVVIGGLALTALSFLLVYAIAARLTRALETLAERVEGSATARPSPSPDSTPSSSPWRARSTAPKRARRPCSRASATSTPTCRTNCAPRSPASAATPRCC